MKVASASDVKRINNLVPKVGIVREILDETPDVKTFRISTPEGEKPFTPMPGQLGMYSLPAVGEAMFSVTNQGDDYIDMSIKKTGLLTELRAREFYEKPTAERKRKLAAAIKRHYKRIRSQQLPKKMY